MRRRRLFLFFVSVSHTTQLHFLLFLTIPASSWLLLAGLIRRKRRLTEFEYYKNDGAVAAKCRFFVEIPHPHFFW